MYVKCFHYFRKSFYLIYLDRPYRYYYYVQYTLYMYEIVVYPFFTIEMIATCYWVDASMFAATVTLLAIYLLTVLFYTGRIERLGRVGRV